MNNFENVTFHRLNGSLARVAGAEVKAQYNPTEITFNKGVQIAEIAIPGLDSPILQFVRGQNETLALDLFFDTTESGTAGGSVEPVTRKTDAFYQLVKIDRVTHAPPVVEVTWGPNHLPGSKLTEQWASQNRDAFRCVVESVQQRFTLFSPEGVPLRATLSVRLKEYVTLEDQVERIRYESRDRTHRRTVHRGDTLAGIAAEVYGDPHLWRAIADHNGLTDPGDLPEGLALEIPPVA
ncbi:MAG TPA: peptidoglycan-binding protein [Thermoanaerobaculia bacterium]|nr:peptidoglycan-binding protein [Thermoanaerobaculia bacterium]